MVLTRKQCNEIYSPGYYKTPPAKTVRWCMRRKTRKKNMVQKPPPKLKRNIKRIMFSKLLQRVALSKCDNCRRRHNYQYGLEDPPVFTIQFEQYKECSSFLIIIHKDYWFKSTHKPTCFLVSCQGKKDNVICGLRLCGKNVMKNNIKDFDRCLCNKCVQKVV